MKAVKTIGIVLAAIITFAVVAVAGYVIYVVATYDRIPDNEPLEVRQLEGSADAERDTVLSTGTEYTMLTFNIGFGAYDQPFSFFMDKGYMADGTETVGVFSRARSELAAKDNTSAAIETALSENADIMLFQEVDRDADRSYRIDQAEAIEKSVEKSIPGITYASYASNFHTALLLYPPTKPIGKISDSGILTLSRYEITSAVRRSYPVSGAFPTKFFDLDRCFAINRMPVEGTEKQLVLINTHMSAYDEGGTIRTAQMELLSGVLQAEYSAGNWVIVGGDFNHALGGSEKNFMGEMKTPDWVQVFDESMLPEGFHMVIAENGTEVATDRDSSIPYEKGVNYEVTLDGFIISKNITATSRNIDANYKASDHNPVIMTFSLDQNS
jgi:endonuclease/exonuclease/phosphatase family metal-dependent hydrolase